MKNDYVLEVTIAASPDRVWDGLTLAEFTRQYWHATRVTSDFRLDSPIQFLTEDDEVGAEGVILECDPPRRLAYTWQFPRNPATREESPSRVTFELAPVDGGTRLRVHHDQFPEGSAMLPLITEGWPDVIQGLKTLLEAA